jgi:hypothetical protein
MGQEMRINLSYRSVFHIKRKEYFCFYLKSEEPLKNLKPAASLGPELCIFVMDFLKIYLVTQSTFKLVISKEGAYLKKKHILRHVSLRMFSAVLLFMSSPVMQAASCCVQDYRNRVEWCLAQEPGPPQLLFFCPPASSIQTITRNQLDFRQTVSRQFKTGPFNASKRRK